MLSTVKRTVEEQAELWRCSRQIVLREIALGELVATKIAGRWLIEPDDAKAYEDARKNRRPTPRRVRRPRRRTA